MDNENDKYVAKPILQLSHRLRRYLDAETLNCGATHMQVMVIHYILKNSDRAVYQRDIESEFGIRRSSVTSILQLMERNGLIERTSVASDARLKQLTVTETGAEINMRVGKMLREAEDNLAAALSEQEQRQLILLLDKINSTLDTMQTN